MLKSTLCSLPFLLCGFSCLGSFLFLLYWLSSNHPEKQYQFMQSHQSGRGFWLLNPWFRWGDLGEPEEFGCKTSTPPGDQITLQKERNAPWHGLHTRQGDILRLEKSTLHIEPLHMLWRCEYRYHTWVRLRSALELCVMVVIMELLGRSLVHFGAAYTAGSIQLHITSEIKINLIPYRS